MRVDQARLLEEIRPGLVGRRAREERLAYLARRLARLEDVPSAAAWGRRAERTRRELLKLYFRGHPAGLLDASCRVQWRGTAFVGPGYRVKKVRFEGYPGLWVPALLYEPWPPGRGPVKLPAVLNPNGHHHGGKAMDYKQARCINLAKRGVLALNYEFLGMGELAGSSRHNRLADLDLAGVAGIGVFYLIMKRALDLLLSHPLVDKTRIAMTGLSGGGWQTIVLSALDERITASIPVAGHSAVWQRIHYREDMGDLEQVPADLCTVADYDVLSGMLAPRPSLFIFNRNDDCCFRTERTTVSVLRPARRIFDLLGSGDSMESHDNEDPGTHNYERDNRRRLYRFLNKHFGLESPEDDLPWKEELLTEKQCAVGLPADNETLLSLARAVARRRKPSAGSGRAPRAELAGVLRLPRSSVGAVRRVGTKRVGEVTLRQLVARIDDCWSVPVVHARPRATASPAGRERPGLEGAAAYRFAGGEVVLAASDAGRQAALGSVMRRCCGAVQTPKPAHVLAADVYGTGELAASWQEHMIMAGAGERPLGIQVAHLLALARWAQSTFGARRVHLHASGMVVSVAALAAVALEPRLFGELVTESLLSSLELLLDWPVDYEQAAPLFCFGLLPRFDIPRLIGLCDGVPVRDPCRGPLNPRGAP